MDIDRGDRRHRTAGCLTVRRTRVTSETFGMMSHGMTEAEVVGRAGQPDRRLDQIEPTPQSQRLISYQYIWGGDTSKGEWTTTITFSGTTNKVIRIDRDRN
jgi:hypothetical protein